MKKLFLKLFLFALLFVVLDQAIGKGLAVLASKPKGGDTGRNIEVADRTTADIILFGSSRCVHHYDPRLLTDSFGLSCYNAGRDGNGILMLYPYYRMLSSRYRPKLIVYDLSIFDVGEDDHTKYLEWLRQFYGRPTVVPIVRNTMPPSAGCAAGTMSRCSIMKTTVGMSVTRFSLRMAPISMRPVRKPIRVRLYAKSAASVPTGSGGIYKSI